MIKVFKLPDLGEGLTESEIVAWHVAPGDTVELNQHIADVETAKAVVELPSPFAGTVTELHQHPGVVVHVGEPIVSFEVSGDGAEALSSGGDGAAQPVESEFSAPSAARTDAAGGAGSVPDGVQVEGVGAGVGAGAGLGEGVAVREAVREAVLVGYGAAAERDGRPKRRPRRAGSVVGSAPLVVEPAPSEVRPARSEVGTAPAVVRPVEAGPAKRPRSTPPVRALARELRVDLASIEGTGPGGLITRDDVRANSTVGAGGREAASVASMGTSTAAVGPPSDATPRSGGVRESRSPIRSLRKLTAAAMVQSAFTAPHVTEFLTVDVTPAVQLLDALKRDRAFAGHHVGILTVVAKALCIAVARNPSVNTRWDDVAGEIVQFHYVNLGIAAATPRGLIVPNIKDAQALSLTELAGALAALTEEARAGTTGQHQLAGGTITITNIGVFGIDAGTPILNPGEAAILAMGSIRRTPWEYQGEIALRNVMTLSLSVDHRLVDGEQASRFLADIGSILANPGMVLAMV